jgi:GT2 family glycosyltransferase
VTVNSSPLVSVVVVVKDDSRLARLLASLKQLRQPDRREVVVVDASEGRLDEIRASHPEVRWCEFPSNGISVAAQRNMGVRESRGDVIAFIDADCVPDRQWLAALVAPILGEEESVVAGGVRSLEGTSIHDGQWEKDATSRRYLDEAPTLNLAVHRRVFDQVGSFDESMRFGSDADFTWRVVESGGRIRYLPEAVVAHDWGGLRANARRAFLYGEARGRLHKKHRWARRRLLGADFVYPAYAVFIAGLPLTLRFRAYPLLLLVPLLKNADDRPVQVVSSNLAAGLGFLREFVVPSR